MNTKEMAMGITAVVIATVIAISCVVPIITDSVKTEDTFTNDGVYTMSKITNGDPDTTTIVWDSTAAKVFNVNGVDIEFTESSSPIPYSIIAADNFALRYTIRSSGIGPDISLYDSSTGGLVYSANSQSNKVVTITLTSGMMTLSDGSGSPKSESYTKAFALSPTGAFVMKKSNVEAYVKSDSEIFGTGRTAVTIGDSTANYNINLVGTVEDIDVTVFYPPEDVTVSDIVISSTSVGSHNDLFKFDQVSFTMTEGTDVNNAVYSQVIVPYKVTAERTVHPDAMTNTILGIVPTMIILGIVVGAVGLFIKTRRD